MGSPITGARPSLAMGQRLCSIRRSSHASGARDYWVAPALGPLGILTFGEITSRRLHGCEAGAPLKERHLGPGDPL